MTIFERTQTSTLSSRLHEVPRHITIVTGPRQTGKTTLVRQALRQLDCPSRYVSVDEPESAILPPIPGLSQSQREFVEQQLASLDGLADARWLVLQWELARLAAESSDRGMVLAIDEIEKIPNWLATVKGLWDADRRFDRPLHIILICSAPMRMQKRLTESLAGRFEVIQLLHWSFEEMSTAFGFDLHQYIYFGGYPGGAPLVSEQSRWRAYVAKALVEPNIERDILALQRVDKPALLKQLFRLCAENSSQVFSYNKILGNLQGAGSTSTLKRYLDFLSHTGLIAGITKYAGGIYPRRASSPKLMLFNTALMAAASGYTFEEAKADRSYWGRLVESAVGAHLINTGVPEHDLHYWREKAYEVDFVMRRGRKLAAFEVNSGRRKSRSSGLRRLAKRFGVQTTVIVGEGGIPLSEFLLTPAREWLDNF